MPLRLSPDAYVTVSCSVFLFLLTNKIEHPSVTLFGMYVGYILTFVFFFVSFRFVSSPCAFCVLACVCLSVCLVRLPAGRSVCLSVDRSVGRSATVTASASRCRWCARFRVTATTATTTPTRKACGCRLLTAFWRGTRPRSTPSLKRQRSVHP